MTPPTPIAPMQNKKKENLKSERKKGTGLLLWEDLLQSSFLADVEFQTSAKDGAALRI